MIKAAAFLALVVLVASASATSVPFKNCGSSSDSVKITSVDADPFPLKAGSPVNLSVKGTIGSSISAGTYHAVVKFDGIQLVKKTGDFCELASCPIAAGPIDISKSITIPAIAPKGDYVVTLAALDGSGAELLCIEISAKMTVEAEEPCDMATKMVTGSPNRYFDGWSLADVSRLLGVKVDPVTMAPVLPEEFPVKEYPASVVESLPTNFDARDQWGSCIGPVLNQGSCGSCWAFACAEAVSDRMCMNATTPTQNGTFVQLAPLDLVTCDNGIFGNDGCEGGALGPAWDYVQQVGLVTEKCAPYGTAEGGPITTCAPDKQPCLPPFVQTPKCDKSCKDGSDWKADKHRVKNVYSLNSLESMKADLVMNGPIEVAFTVYEDFVSFDFSNGAVYTHTSGQMLGGHAVKLIGYGQENGEEYLLLQNSWTPTWGGYNGFFRMKACDCGMCGGAVAGTF